MFPWKVLESLIIKLSFSEILVLLENKIGWMFSPKFHNFDNFFAAIDLVMMRILRGFSKDFYVGIFQNPFETDKARNFKLVEI